jgi:hypothetical protein
MVTENFSWLSEVRRTVDTRQRNRKVSRFKAVRETKILQQLMGRIVLPYNERIITELVLRKYDVDPRDK